MALLSTGKDFIERNQEETTLIPIGQHNRLSENRLGRERFFLPSLLVITALAFILKWTLLITVALLLISAIACGLSHAEKLKQEFKFNLRGKKGEILTDEDTIIRFDFIRDIFLERGL